MFKTECHISLSAFPLIIKTDGFLLPAILIFTKKNGMVLTVRPILKNKLQFIFIMDYRASNIVLKEESQLSSSGQISKF